MKPHHEAVVHLHTGGRLFVMGTTGSDFPTVDGMIHFQDAKGRIHIVPAANVARIQVEPTGDSINPNQRRTPRPKVHFTDDEIVKL
jgi:hypothetical protein